MIGSLTIPVIIFAYVRAEHLARTLACLRENNVPLIYAFSDGPKTPDLAPKVEEVREILRQVDWCDIQIIERNENFGLGRSIVTGVSEILKKHEMVIVFEDDLVCVPGTYDYLCAALTHYKDTPNVMSVTGWTHHLLTPTGVVDQPYFDGRTDCLVWGTWDHAWRGMDDMDALTIIKECKFQGIDVYRYGADLIAMAEDEQRGNIWAVRFSFLHILRKGLCLRPPYSLVQHIGYDQNSTNVKSMEGYIWHVEIPKVCPPIPSAWPPAIENPECAGLWQKVFGGKPKKPTVFQRSKSFLRSQVSILTGKPIFETMALRDFAKLFIPPAFLYAYRLLKVGKNNNNILDQGMKKGLCLTGDYKSWKEAEKDSSGYDTDVILEKTRQALLKVKNGEAIFERDSVLFDKIQYSWPLLAGLMLVAARSGGELNVLDFGGSLGSTYFQNRAFFGELNVRWNIIEQTGHVEVGKKWFEDERLKFYPTISACLAATQPNVILLSGVLQYLPEPYGVLEQLSAIPCQYLLIDRTPFWQGPSDRLCVQHVPDEIYLASYPCWIFSDMRFQAYLQQKWGAVTDFKGFDNLTNPVQATWRGFVMVEKDRV